MSLRNQANRATLSEAAEILDIPRRTLVSRAARGTLPTLKEPIAKAPGWHYVVDLEDVEVSATGRGRKPMPDHLVKPKSLARRAQRRKKNGAPPAPARKVHKVVF